MSMVRVTGLRPEVERLRKQTKMTWEQIGKQARISPPTLKKMAEPEFYEIVVYKGSPRTCIKLQDGVVRKFVKFYRTQLGKDPRIYVLDRAN